MQLGFKLHPLVFYLHLNTDTDVKMSLHAINTHWQAVAASSLRFYVCASPFFVAVNNTPDPSIFPLNMNVLWKSPQLYWNKWYSSFTIQQPQSFSNTRLQLRNWNHPIAILTFRHIWGWCCRPLGGGGEGWRSRGPLEIPNKGFCRLN